MAGRAVRLDLTKTGGKIARITIQCVDKQKSFGRDFSIENMDLEIGVSGVCLNKYIYYNILTNIDIPARLPHVSRYVSNF